MEERKKLLVLTDHQNFDLLEGLYLGGFYEVTSKREIIDGVRWLARGNYPDLILLDLKNPEDMGTDFLFYIKSNPKYRAIPIVLASNEQDKKVILEYRKLGVVTHLVKPFSSQLLQKKIENVFVQREGLREMR